MGSQGSLPEKGDDANHSPFPASPTVVLVCLPQYLRYRTYGTVGTYGTYGRYRRYHTAACTAYHHGSRNSRTYIKTVVLRLQMT